MFKPTYLTIRLAFCITAAGLAIRCDAQTFKTLYAFTGGKDGGAPWGPPLLYNGYLFGTTYYGGGPSSAQVGTVFQFYPVNGQIATYYAFAGEPNDGAYPMSGLSMDPYGDIFGTTTQGGTGLRGIIFELGNGFEVVLYNFTGPDGQSPEGNLLADAIGNVYGTTALGGENNSGTVYAFSAGGVLIVLHSFGNAPGDGIAPVANLILVKGVLYGTTSEGGEHGWGTVFSVEPKTKTETVLFSFDGKRNGATPEGGLVADGQNLYGTTSAGGSSRGAAGNGTIFKLNIRSKAYSVVHKFQGTDGSEPTGVLITDGQGNFYGTTFAGGAHGLGSVFQFNTAGVFTTLYSFGNTTTDGAFPYGGLTRDSSGNLYGSTTRGGQYGWGTLFEITPAQ